MKSGPTPTIPQLNGSPSSHPAAGEISIHHRGQALQVAAEPGGSQEGEDAGGRNHGTCQELMGFYGGLMEFNGNSWDLMGMIGGFHMVNND